MKTTTVWKTGHAFNSFKESSKVEIDAKGGFNPKALLLSGLAACSGVDVVDILEKMRVPFSNLAIEAEADQTDDPPRVFKTIHLTFRVTTEESNRSKVKKAVDLSLEKYCGVAAMLRKNSAIEYNLLLEEPKEPAG